MSTTAVVVDTNVAVVANDASRADPDWPPSCVLACIEAIERVMSVAPGRRFKPARPPSATASMQRMRRCAGRDCRPRSHLDASLRSRQRG
jgi:hypothetical protein